MQDSFGYMTGFGVVFTDIKGGHLGQGCNLCSFCEAINNTPEGIQLCEASNRKAIALSMQTMEPTIYQCHAGLINIEYPLIYNGEHIGSFTAGGVRCENSTDYPQDEAAKSVKWLESAELENYFYNDVKVLSNQKIEATAIALYSICNYMLQTAGYNKLQQDLMEKQQQLLVIEKTKLELEHQLTLAKFDALQKQVSPHFIFNVINAGSRLITLQEYTKAQDMFISFAKMMRYSLYNIQATVTLKQELDYIRNYLAVQEIRFSEWFTYDIFCAPEIEDIEIPFFCLQPLVENSLEHGLLSEDSEGGKVEIRCQYFNDVVVITIADDGKGISKEKLEYIKKNSFTTNDQTQNVNIGLYNSYNRLKLKYGSKVTVEISSVIGEGTRIKISIG